MDAGGPRPVARRGAGVGRAAADTLHWGGQKGQAWGHMRSESTSLSWGGAGDGSVGHADPALLVQSGTLDCVMVKQNGGGGESCALPRIHHSYRNT